MLPTLERTVEEKKRRLRKGLNLIDDVKKG